MVGIHEPLEYLFSSREERPPFDLEAASQLKPALSPTYRVTSKRYLDRKPELVVGEHLLVVVDGMLEDDLAEVTENSDERLVFLREEPYFREYNNWEKLPSILLTH